MKNQESMPKISAKMKNYMFFLGLSVFLALSVVVGHIVSGFLSIPVSTQVQNLSSPNFNIYFLSLNKSQVEASARALAEDYQKLGAGGYIWQFDDYFHILSSGYENENDATLVQNSLKKDGIESEKQIVKFDGFSLAGDFSVEQKKLLTKAIKCVYTTYQSLYDIAISLDTSVYNEISARLAINNVHTNVNNIVFDFNTLFSESEDKIINLIGDSVKQTNIILENLVSGKKLNANQTHSSLIKYRYSQILYEYKLLLEDL